MKKFIAFFAALAMVSSIFAGETKPESLPDQATPSATPSSSLSDPGALIPEPLPMLEKPLEQVPDDPQRMIDNAREQLKKPKVSAAADELRERIHFRQAKTRALKDEKVQEKWNEVQSAKTDAVKMESLKQFYTLLFDRMLKVDASLKTRIEKVKSEIDYRIEKPALVDLKTTRQVKF
jgi:hypothetical protein